MKAKIFSKLTMIGLLVIGMASCNESSFLDLTNPNKQTEADFWNSKDDAMAAMATIYSPVRAQMYGYFGAFTGFQNLNVRSDDTYMIFDDPQTWTIANFTNTPNTARYDFDVIYRCIQRANIFLANIDRVPGLTDDEKDVLRAEAQFFRGFSYFLLVTNWGDVPLRLTPTEDVTEDIMLASSPAADIWKQVESDLTYAKQYLPVTRPESEAGRVTKGAAIAYLGKSYIFQEKFSEGEAELKIIMQSPYSYDLVANYEHNFRDDTELNEESIFEIVYNGQYGSGTWGDEEATSTQGMVLPTFIAPPKTGGWFKLMPSAFLIDEFTTERRPEGSDTKFDKRMYTSFYFKYSDFNDVVEDEIWYGGNHDFDALWESTSGKRASGEPDFSLIDGVKGRFIYKKYTNFWSTLEKGDDMYQQVTQNNNYRIMRFAEILLLHAEACVKIGKLAEAATDINRIRTRAGLVEKSWSGADELMKEIEHQKLLEFSLEGIRFFDLIRWYTPNELKQKFIQNDKQGAENFMEKHFYYPIPAGETETNTAIRQNPLW